MSNLFLSWVASVSQQKSPSELDQPMIGCDWLKN